MLVAVAGHAGAGKTTAIAHLRGRLGGQVKYVGSYVTAEVKNRGLDLTQENERRVRLELRKGDSGALARLAFNDIRKLSASGPVLLDAIYTPAERSVYEAELSVPVIVVALVACFETRVLRLSSRSNRPITEEQLIVRDRVEVDQLGLDRVIQHAHFRVSNESTIDALKAALDVLPF